MKHLIKILNPVEAVIDAALEALIRPTLSYKSAIYVPGPHHKRRIETDKSVLKKIKGGFLFYAGLVDHVVAYCREKNIEVIVDDQSIEDTEMFEPLLPGITFREDQTKLLNSWLDKPRGIIVSPTGSGKTVLGFGCLSAFEKGTKILWLCHKKDLMNQACEEAIKFGFTSVGKVGDGFSELNKDLTIATRQSFKKLADEYGHIYDVVVVDEVHHISKSSSAEYQYALSKILAPFRLGLTATPIREGEAFLSVTGLIGPIVGELTINEGNDLGILAKPIIKLLRVPINHDVKNLRKYAEVYSAGIVCNQVRNQIIATTTKKHIDIGESVLIMINHLDHGNNILIELEKLGIWALFVRGETKSDARNDAKNDLDSKDIHCVICSGIWSEGVNIKSLNVVITAGGGKSEINVMQNIGRGLRKTTTKDTVYIYDFVDLSHHYLTSHFAERLLTYMDAGWL